MKKLITFLLILFSIKTFAETTQPALTLPSVTFPLEIINKRIEEKPPLKPPEKLQLKEKIQIKLFTEDIDPIPPYYIQLPIFDIKKPKSFFGLPRENALVSSAIDDLFNKRYFSAEEKLLSAIKVTKDKPETGKAFYILGIIEHRLGNIQASYKYLKKACEFDKPFYEKDFACFSAAIVATQLGNVLEAEKYLEKTTLDNENILFWKGVLYLLKGNKEKAFSILSKIPCDNLDINFIDYCRYMKGYIYFWNKDFAKSLEYIKSLKDNKYQKQILVIKGFDYLSLGNLEEAEKVFKAFIEGYGTIDKISDYVIYGLAVIDIKKGRYKDALEKAGTLETRNKILAQNIYMQLASAFSEQGKFEDSFALLQKSLQISPEYKNFLKKKIAVAAYNTGKYKYAYMLMKDIDEPLFKLYTAFTLMKLGNLKEAERYLKEAYEKSSDIEIKKEALKYLADIYYYANKDDKLLKIVKELAKYDNDYAKNLLGWFFFKKKLYDKALISFTDLYMKAVSAFNSGDLETAERIAKLLNNRKGKFLLAYIYLKKGNIEEAKNILKALSEGSDDIARKAAYMYAYIFFSQGDYNQAIKAFQDVINRFPNTKEADRALLKIANAYYNLGDKEKARQIYQEYIQKHANTPEAIEAAYQLALLEMKGSDQDVTKQIEEFIKKYPNYPFINLLLVQLADAYAQKGEYEKAKELYKKVIEKDVEESEYALYKLAYIEFNYGRKGKALVLLREYLNRYPNGKYAIQVRELLAKAFESFGKYGDAIEVLKQLPRTPENELKLAQLLFKNGDYTEAKSYFEDLYNRFPKMRSDIAYYLGKIQYILGYYQNALKYLNEALRGSDYNHVAESYYLIGMIYKQLGKKEEALNNIVNVIYLYPEAKDIVQKARIEAAKLMKELGRRYEASCIIKPLLKEDVPLKIRKEALKLKRTLPACME